MWERLPLGDFMMDSIVEDRGEDSNEVQHKALLWEQLQLKAGFDSNNHLKVLLFGFLLNGRSLDLTFIQS
jgi:hypothetical protein